MPDAARRRTEGLTDLDLGTLVDGEIEAALDFESTDISDSRERAIQYEDGEMNDTPSETGRSSVVSFDVRDTIDWIMPGLLRLFLATDQVVIYQPTQPGDLDSAKDATDYVNYKFLCECDGFNVLHDAFHDALLTRNGYVKHWWEDYDDSESETHYGLSEDEYTNMVEPDDVEVAEHTPYEDTGLHDVKITRSRTKGRLCIMAVPPEEILINREAIDWGQGKGLRFIAHKWTTKTRSDLVTEGYDRDLVDDLPSYDNTSTPEADARRADIANWRSDAGDRSQDLIEGYECYVHCDYDGDGIAEWRRVIRAGSSGSRVLLANEEWDDELPFSDFRTGRVPHKWHGRSIHDLLQDIQRIKTVLWRQSLDNLYLQNYPQRAADLSLVRNPQELINPTLGGVVNTKGPPAAVIQPLTIPFVAKESFGALEVLDAVIEKRTGVSRQTMQLDPDALQNQTATAAQLAHNAAYSRIEMIGRLLAEGGMKRFFHCLLKLVAKYQTEPDMIRRKGSSAPPPVPGMPSGLPSQGAGISGPPGMAAQAGPMAIGGPPSPMPPGAAPGPPGALSAPPGAPPPGGPPLGLPGPPGGQLGPDNGQLGPMAGQLGPPGPPMAGFQAMMPSQWNPKMQATINTGLGTGSREKDMMVSMQILNVQKEIVAKYGWNPLVTPKNVYNALARFTESAGVKDTDLFFGEIGEAESTQMMQQQKKDPKQEQAQQELQIKQMEMQGKLTLQKMKQDADIELDKQKAQLEAQLKMQTMQADFSLKQQQMAQEQMFNARQQAAQTLQPVRFGGEVG
jgi:hypothetical protein